MKKIKVYQYDAFSLEPNKGNPAGVILNGNKLTEEEMQEIALKAGFNECAFPIQSSIADVKIRYFTPGHEMNLCGHATMATIYALRSRGFLNGKSELTIETKAGILPITIDGQGAITMKQAAPQFEAFNGSRADLAASIGLAEEELHSDLPIMYGSTGIWTLLIPVKHLSSFRKMKPVTEQFPSILKEMPNASVHPFCLETYDANANMHARHFSSPVSGTIEDAVTGTASGVMGAYYANYIQSGEQDLLVEQGYEIGKDGRVKVTVTQADEAYEVRITGNAVYVKEFEVDLEKERA